MKKTEKKVQIKKMIADFFSAKDPSVLTELRDKIYNEIFKLPMSSNDKNSLEEAMYLWNYNSNTYIKNTKSTTAKATVINDFSEIMKTIDISLLGN